MSESKQNTQTIDASAIGLPSGKVHAKRLPGRFATLKKYSQLALWLPFFLLPYLRWQDRQAILFDIDHSRFHLFHITIYPDDIWMLALVLLLAAMTLFAVTALVSRAWCGYFCFQTAWTDWFSWLEQKIEGPPQQRRTLDAAPWGLEKVAKKTIKHSLWILLSLFTGISFSLWFYDAQLYWSRLLSLDLPLVGWIVLLMFLLGTYLLAGFLREQTCFWLCPYARIQGVMADSQTLMPSYDAARGEPRHKRRRHTSAHGDCIDCDQCVQVCPTGIDIRQGQQLGCITCGLCIDACDGVMDKIQRPRGLIRYASLNELQGGAARKLYQHPRVWVYLGLMILSIAGIIYGLNHISPLSLSVGAHRQPLYVKMSDGSIQNGYDFKVMNKTKQSIQLQLQRIQGITDYRLSGTELPIQLQPGERQFFTLFVRTPPQQVTQPLTPIRFMLHDPQQPDIRAAYPSHFHAP